MAVSERTAESVQDRMLRDADRAFYGDDERACETCRSYDPRDHRAFDGHTYSGFQGVCLQLDCVCDHDAPACEWWSA